MNENIENKAMNDCLALFELFTEKNFDHQTFDAISAAFQRKFGKNDYLSLGTLLLCLIRQNDLQGIVQRLAGYYVLMDMFKYNGQTESPFQMALIEVFEAKEMSKTILAEKFFLAQLLVNGTKDLIKQTPTQVLQTDLQYMATVVHDVVQNKIQSIKKPSDLPATVKASMCNMIPASPRLFETSDKPVKEFAEGISRKEDSPLKNVFMPEFLTIAPPLLPCEDELVWFDLTNPAWHKPLFDTTMCNKSDPCIEAKRLMDQAFKQALTTQDQQRLFTELDNDSELLNQNSLLTPQKLPDLVENNPLVAINILLKLMNSDQITEYLCVLVNMELSLHSIEVVNRLTNSVDLPPEFVHLYISNCITTCELIKDKYMQSRLVRLVCVFLQSLIRNKIINVKELFLELESFCIEFSWIREAAALYRLLRQLETGETGTPSTT